MARLWEPHEQFCGYHEAAAKPLPRFDGRPVELVKSRPARGLGKNSLTLRYWQAGSPFRDISVAAFRLALTRAQKAIVAFCYQSQGSTMLRLRLVPWGSLFHLVGQAKAEKLLAEGLVDAIEEVRP